MLIKIIQQLRPPPGIPAVIIKIKDAYHIWISLHRDFPKTERFGLGRKIDFSFIDILESSFTASYQPPEQKIISLRKTITKLDALKFFLQISWENGLVAPEKYIGLSKNLEEIGRMLGGWKKGLQSKTPIAWTGEK